MIQREIFYRSQQTNTIFNQNNDLPILSKKYEEQKGKGEENIYSIYKSNLKKANRIIQEKTEVFETSEKNSENQEIIIYITNNKTNINMTNNKTNTSELKFIEKLNKIKAVLFKDLTIPKITYEMIQQKIENTKYEKNEEDNILLKDYENNINLNYNLFYNKFMFYSKNKISLFTPHIIKSTNNMFSLFLPVELNLSDFVYKDYHKNINNDVFLNLLKLRIKEFNEYEKKNGKILDEKYNEKIFGFNKNILGNNFYLYSIMDKKIISDKLENVNINKLFEDLTAAESQIDRSKTLDRNIYNCYEMFNKNMNFLKGLTYEELILYIILDKIENKYENFPRIMFYEYYLTLNGEKVVVSDEIEPGYSEVDCVIYSKVNYKYEKEPLIVQKKYNCNYNNLSYYNGNFEIEENTLYFIELKSSFDFTEEEDGKKKFLKQHNP